MAMLSANKMSVSTRAARRAAAPARRVLAVRASAEPDAKSGLTQVAESIGLPAEEGVFGFRPFAEVWVGRWAMIGFVSSIVGEATSGRGTLRQIGLEPSPELLAGMLTTLGVALVAGTAATALKLGQKKMTAKDVARYKNFLGLNNANDFVIAAADMKRKGDFTTPGDNLKAIAKAKAAGSPVDAFLSTNELAEGAAAAAALKADGGAGPAAAASGDGEEVAAGTSAPRAAKGDILDEPLFKGYEAKYARQTEITNGRAAMVGFLAAVLVEAGTGKGILMQIIMWLKITGFLGAASGF